MLRIIRTVVLNTKALVKSGNRGYAVLKDNAAPPIYIDHDDLRVIRGFLESETEYADWTTPDIGEFETQTSDTGIYEILADPDANGMNDQVAIEIMSENFSLKHKNKIPHICSDVYFNLAKARE